MERNNMWKTGKRRGIDGRRGRRESVIEDERKRKDK